MRLRVATNVAITCPQKSKPLTSGRPLNVSDGTSVKFKQPVLRSGALLCYALQSPPLTPVSPPPKPASISWLETSWPLDSA